MKGDAKQRDFELREGDLLGHSLDDVACAQCGGVFCGLRVGRVYQGKPLILCSRKDEVKDILSKKSGFQDWGDA